MIGSSPLARGLLKRVLAHYLRNRIIPARAGFTYGGDAAQWLREDHPRSRGVYCTRTMILRSDLWIIPARAGFTAYGVGHRLSLKDHPRSRGVYSHAVPPNPRIMGSSPLARGLPFAAAPLDAQGGIIPARAGFTRASPWTDPPTPDHPRSRGVYLSSMGRGRVLVGSSPLARGLRAPARLVTGGGRIIPARAGFTRALPALSDWSWDHPRSRGVYAAARGARDIVRGSSPLARGLLRRADRARITARIIPARAGFTSSMWRAAGREEDHPRSRGVYGSS